MISANILLFVSIITLALLFDDFTWRVKFMRVQVYLALSDGTANDLEIIRRINRRGDILLHLYNRFWIYVALGELIEEGRVGMNSKKCYWLESWFTT